MPKVFISHSTHDRRFVEDELIPALAARGVGSWYSKQDIHGATEWAQRIVAGLEECDWFLVVMSRRSAESQWVRDEVHWAMDYRWGRIVPVLIDDCDPMHLHIRLRRVQFIDFRRDRGRAREELLRVWGFSAPASPPPPKEEVKRPPFATDSGGGNRPKSKAAALPTPETLKLIAKYRKALIWGTLTTSSLLVLLIFLVYPSSPADSLRPGPGILFLALVPYLYCHYPVFQLSRRLYTPGWACFFTFITFFCYGFIYAIPFLLYRSTAVLRVNGGDLDLFGKTS